MKKSLIFCVHYGFWCLYILNYVGLVLFEKLITRTDRINAMYLHGLVAPIIFYASYFLTHLVIKNKKNIFLLRDKGHIYG